MEVNGTSIVDVTDPAKTRYLAHIPSGEGRGAGGSQMIRVCSGNTLPRAVKGKWYLLRPLGGRAHEIWDVTDPSKPTKLTTVVDNLTGTHKSWWECDTGIAYLVANNSKEGWKGGNHLKIYDLSDPAKPVYIRDFGMVGTQPNARERAEAAAKASMAPISAGPEKNRVYIAYGTGNDGVVSIVDRKKLLTEFKNPLNPTEEELLAPQVGYIHMSPDQGAHTTFPIFGVPIPGFQGHQALRKRDLLLVVSEAGRSDNCGQNFPSDQLTQGRAGAASRVPARYHARADAMAAFDVPCSGDPGRLLRTRRAVRRALLSRIVLSALLRQDRRDGVVQRGRPHLGHPRPVCHSRGRLFVPPPNQNTVPTCANAETKEGGEFGTTDGHRHVQERRQSRTTWRLTTAA